MNIREINKATYTGRLNKFYLIFFATFACLSLVFGYLLISWFGTTIVDPETQSNFRFNLLGVILALLLTTLLVNHFKNHPLLDEIYYVWQLKQVHNRIYRKLAKIKSAGEEGDINALIILAFYFKTTRMVYVLDNNTLTLSKVDLDISKLEESLQEKQINEDVEQLAAKFDQSLIAKF